MPELDRGQLWTFATLASVASYLLLIALFAWQESSKRALLGEDAAVVQQHKYEQPWVMALMLHGLFFSGLIVTFLVAYFGFKSDFPLKFANLYFPLPR